MPLPSWVGQNERRLLQPIEIGPPADSIWTAPGWRLWGKESWTCVPPVDMPIDPVVLRAIHEFDPGAIPIWRKRRYLPPGDTQPVLFTHYAIGRHVRDPKGDRRLFHVEMPRNATHPAPNLLEFVLQIRGTRMMHHGGPGDHLPFGMGLYHALRDKFLANKTALQLADEQIALDDAERERIERENKAEEERRQAILAKRLTPIFEKVTRQDYLKHVAKVNGLLRPSKPFVHVGRSAR